MGSAEPLDALVAGVTAALADGGAADAGALAALAATTDVLSLGALADDARRARHGDRTTFVRVHAIDVAHAEPWPAVPPAAAELRLIGRPASVDAATAAVRQARALGGSLPLRGFWLADIAALAAGAPHVFAALRDAGLDEIAYATPAPSAAQDVELARAAGLGVRVIAVEAPPARRVDWLVAARALADAAGGITAVAPLPQQIDRTAPTTGFDDVRAVALCRLLLASVPTVQVDWSRYGPKLAQVALGVGADDLDHVAAVDDPALGPRRLAVEEVRRNITAAGLTAVERDGRWTARDR